MVKNNTLVKKPMNSFWFKKKMMSNLCFCYKNSWFSLILRSMDQKQLKKFKERIFFFGTVHPKKIAKSKIATNREVDHLNFHNVKG